MGSVWILDGARIHCHPDIVYYLRSLGIVPIFLPAYCPFFNPVEVLFGLIKKAVKRRYKEGSNVPLAVSVAQTLEQFQSFDLTKVFEHCGWKLSGVFDPTGPLSHDKVTIAGMSHSVDNLLEYVERDHLEEEYQGDLDLLSDNEADE